MSSLFPFTTRDLVTEARREVALRESVYPRLVERGKLSQKRADLHLSLMRAIVEKLESLTEESR